VKDKDKTQKQLLNELADLRQQVVDLEASEAEREQAEKALGRSEEAHRLLFEQSVDGIVIIAKGRIVRANRAFCDLHGLSVEDVVGMNPLDLVHPEDRNTGDRRIKAVQSGKPVPESQTYRAFRADGASLWVEVRSNHLEWEGEPALQSIVRDVTERVRSEEERARAEEALKESGRERAIILNSVSELVTYQDKEFRVIWANRAAGDSAGSLPEQLVGRHCYEIWQQRSEVCVGCPIAKSLETGQPEQAEMTSPDGRVWFIQGYPVRDANGDVVGAVETTMEITARVRSEEERARAVEALRESEERFRSIVENSQAGILIVGEDFRFIYVNDELCRILDRRQEEIIGHDFREFLDEEGRALVVDHYRRRQAGEDVPPRYEFNVVRRGGELRRVEISSTVIRDAQERVRTIAQILDITERVRSEEERAQADEALRASEKRFRSIAETANDAIIIFDSQDCIFYWNQAAQIIFGYQAGETHGKLLASIVPGRFHDIFRQEMARVVSAEASDSRGKTVEMMGIRKDGNEFPLELSLAAWRTKENTFFTAIVRDITGRKRAEEEARQRTRDLALVNTLHHAVNQGDSLQDVIDLLCRETGLIFSGSGMAVYLLDRSKEHLVLQNLPLSLETVNRIEKLIGIEIPPVRISLKTQPVYRKILQTSDIQISDDPATIKKMMAACTENKALQKLVPAIYKLLGHRSVMSVPLVSKGEAIGLMDISRKEPFTESDLKRFEIISKQLTALIKRKQAEEALEFRVKQLAALGQASRAVTVSLELDQVLAKIVSLAGEVVATDYTSVVLMDETGQMNDSADNVPGIPTIEYRIRDEGLTDWIVRSRWVAVIDEIGEDGAISPNPGEGAPCFANPLLVKAGVRSLAGLPLVVKDRLLGVLYLHSLQTNAFRDQLPLLIAFANQVAIAIENARLYEKAQRELAERERVEKALRASQEYARSVIDSSLDMIITVTMDRRIVEFNRAAQATFGYDQESVVGKPVDMLYANQQEAITIHETTVAKGQCVQEIFNRRKNGEIFPALLSASVLRDAQGKVIGVMGVSRDIAENKRIEKQLRQQERMAAVGQLSGGIAHDFNNFLTAIMLYAQLLLAKPHLPLDLAPNIEIILDESRGAARLVQQILDFSRRAMIETGPVDLKPSIGKTVSILGRTLPENIRLVVKTEMEEHSAPFTVNADPTRIRQVLMNLALNARDAMPLGGELGIGLSRVEVKAGDEPPVANMPAGDWVCLTISDTGTGIPPDILPHVFEPFFTTKGPGKGTGLGLAQVHGIVGQHRGYIGVETEIGQGTTFRVYLPAHEAEGTGESPEKAPTPPEGRGETILLAEDEERVRKAGQEILESLGYRVLVAADGREALEVYRSAEEIHLVITDLMMPEMGGSELAQALKKEHPHVKVLAITGYAIGEDKYLKEAGILAVVQKPFDVDTLAKTVRWALEVE
jgi:PAS domain S-box-containing protein